MREDRTGLGDRAEDLRRAFDRSFAEAPLQGKAAVVDLLAIRVAGDAYAFRLVEAVGLYVDRVVTPIPTLVPELLGVAGLRATLVPVYDLRALLGYSSSEVPRWLVSTVGGVALGLAFDQFEAHLRVPSAALVADDTNARGHVRHVVRTPAGTWPLIHLPSIFEAIKARTQRLARPKER